MTQSSEQRLDRLEALAETTLLAIQQLAAQQREFAAQQQAFAAEQRELVAQQRDTQTQLTNSIQDVVGMITQLSEDAAEDRKLIVGLQTENCRILERLEQHMSNGHGGQ